MSMHPAPYAFDEAELARRRSASRRMAWLIGLAAALIYIGGFFLQR